MISDANNGDVATLKLPALDASVSRIISMAVLSSVNTCSAVGKKALPLAVSSSFRVVRSNNRTASSDSRLRISIDNADGVRCNFSAARVILCSCAIAMNALSCLIVMLDVRFEFNYFDEGCSFIG
jgi:hypothetical protein